MLCNQLQTIENSTDFEQMLELQNLIPNTFYNIWIRQRPAKASEEDLVWSESIDIRIKTKPTGKSILKMFLK